MDAHRFDLLSRTLAEGPSRRAALTAGLGGMLAALGLDAQRQLTVAGKRKKHRKRKKHKNTGAPPYASCEERCHPSCTRCYLRPEGTPLCASQGASNCNYNCSSDSNCVGTGYPYCTLGQFHFATGTLQLHDSCLNGNTMICTDVNPCG